MAESENRLEGLITEVYKGPLDDFVRRRDSLAKELRSAGEREAAALVKALRKPSRPAWALDQAALDSPETVELLVEAVSRTVDVQAAGGDVRAAVAGLRTTVRDFASRAAHAAQKAGVGMDSSALVNAVFAVLGRTESFDQLRRGHLAEVPEAGGLDLLTALSAPTEAAASPATGLPEPPRPTAAPDLSAKQATLEAEAREAAERAMAALASARERSVAARVGLGGVESELAAAESRLRDAETEVRTLTSQRDHARREADTAAAELLEAEKGAAEAERRLGAAILHGGNPG